MPPLCATSAESAATHVLAKNQVAGARAPAAVEALFAAVVNAGDARGGQLHGHHVESQVTIALIAAEPAFSGPFSDLIVIVDDGHDLVAIPPVFGAIGLIQLPVAEDGEVIERVALAQH